MDKLEAGALGSVTTQVRGDGNGQQTLSIDVSGSMMRVSKLLPTQSPKTPITPISGGGLLGDSPQEALRRFPGSSERVTGPQKGSIRAP